MYDWEYVVVVHLLSLFSKFAEFFVLQDVLFSFYFVVVEVLDIYDTVEQIGGILGRGIGFGKYVVVGGFVFGEKSGN